MSNFAETIPHGLVDDGGGIPLMPPWWTGPHIEDLLSSFGAQLDAMSEQSLVMRLQSNPFAGGANATRQGAARLADGRLIECEPFVLPVLADQKGIRLYPSEPTLSRRVRTSRALQLHAERGTHRGELQHLAPYFLPGTAPTVRIFHQSGGASPSSTCHELSPAGVYTPTQSATSNWDWDGNGTGSGVLLAPAWQASHAYVAGALITNDGGKLYLCTGSGTSAGSGGPTGTGTAIADGGATWEHRWAWSRWWAVLYLDGVVAAPALWDDGIALWDDGVTVWDGVSSIVLGDWISMLRDWGAAHSACWGVAVTWADPAVRFPPTGTSTTDPAGWTSRPVGNYGRLVDPSTGLATRPPDVIWIYDPYSG